MTAGNKHMLIGGLAALGLVTGIIVAVKRKSGLWGGVGWSFVGNVAGAGLGYVVAAIIPNSK